MKEFFYWDSFDCEVQCEEVYIEEIEIIDDEVEEFPEY